jgi:hypothetical protein
MRKHPFRPSLNDVLEDRLALSHTGAAGVVHVAHPRPHQPGTPVLRSSTLNDVNRKIDLAFAQFNRAYTKEVRQVDRTGDQARFEGDLAASEAKLKLTLDRQAARIPGGGQTLAQTLNARVGSLVKDLKSYTTQSSTDLVRADQSGARADVLSYVHDEVTKGDFSLK